MSILRELVVKPLKRSRGWRKVRNAHIKKQPFCVACGRRKLLEVHHILDFSEHPELELDDNNLITLCDSSMRCHRLIGHLGDWKSINPKVVGDAIAFLRKRRDRRGIKAKEYAYLTSLVPKVHNIDFKTDSTLIKEETSCRLCGGALNTIDLWGSKVCKCDKCKALFNKDMYIGFSK